QEAEAAVQQRLEKDKQRIEQAVQNYMRRHDYEAPEDLEKGLLRGKYLRAHEVVDPWGNDYRIEAGDARRRGTFTMTSAGPDGVYGTRDDRVMRGSAIDHRRRGRGGVAGALGGIMMKGQAVEEMAAEAEVMPMATADMAAEAPPAAENEAGAQAQPRIREYFPETLLFEPGLITDAKGRAQLTFPIADSITTWRMTMMGNSLSGALGSGTEPIRVFQDFFVDIDFPVALTQNDKVWVPVAVFNYLKEKQTVTLTARAAEWYELEGESEIKVTLEPNEVKGVKFPITVKKIGFHRFTVVARGSKMSDAVARSVEVVPDGKEMRISESGRLNGPVTHTLRIPGNSIEDASKIFVKVYPGVFSQVVEGLDSILRMPGGCFEQTSSATYPNILVMDYMKTTGKVTPEIQMKAEGFINSGYQRLLSFECDGGGFEWFGKNPAHRILTAYGLMEFYDMSKVHDVDPAVIQRTQAWLARCQEEDGSYKPSAGGIQEGAINKFTSDVFRNTAYITWALAQTGYKGPEVKKGLSWLEENLSKIEDPYTLALAANAFAVSDPDAAATGKLIDRLVAAATIEDGKAFWAGATETPTHGTGDSADIETTGLAIQALIKHGKNLDLISQGVTYLAGCKDSFGTWQTTQATIQAMRAMIMAESDATKMIEATIPVIINGKTVQTLTVTKDNSDVMQLVDLVEHTKVGDNEVKLGFAGQGGLMYQIVGRYYEPFEQAPVADEPLSIDVAYDRTELAANDIVTVTATVATNRPGIAKMVMIDLGIPPGFTVLPGKLEKLVEMGQIEKFSITGRQIIVYLREVVENAPVKIKVDMLAKYPIKAKTPKSVTYEYYNPKVRSESAPIELTVKSD
ncbi:MAG: alpha-2-macroglobulin family protein, partial [Planctomycetota bacterium]